MQGVLSLLGQERITTAQAADILSAMLSPEDLLRLQQLLVQQA